MRQQDVKTPAYKESLCFQNQQLAWNHAFPCERRGAALHNRSCRVLHLIYEYSQRLEGKNMIILQDAWVFFL